MSTSLTSDELQSLPVFPLPNVVVFPGTRLPLHLFEPRYRAMVEHCLTTDRHVLAVTQLRPGWESNYEGRPPFHEIAGAGRLIAHERRADGTYDIVLQAVSRVRLTEIESPHPFRLARAELLHDLVPDDVSSTDIASLVSLATEISGLLRRGESNFEVGFVGDESPAALADLLANRCLVDASLRQQVLEAVHVPSRVRLVTAALAELNLALSRRSGRPSDC